MWDEVKQARCNALRAAARQGVLTEVEGAELRVLTQELDALEAAYLHPATERVRQEREALGEQNSQLEELLREQQDYLSEIRTLVADLEVRGAAVASTVHGYHWAGLGRGQGRDIGMTAAERATLRQFYNFRYGY